MGGEPRERKIEKMSESNREETDKGAAEGGGDAELTVILLSLQGDTSAVHELHQWY